MSQDSKQGGTYQLIDSGNMRKLEQVGPYRLIRPSPQAIWQPQLSKSEWRRADAVFERDSKGEGQWNWKTKVSRDFELIYDSMYFQIQLTNFGHMGLFAEQIENWNWIRDQIRTRMAKTNDRNLNVLNLFAYTGGSTLAASQAGAHVVHVFDLAPATTAAVVMMAALPCAVNPFLLASRYENYMRRASAAIVLSTGLSVITLPIVLALYG